MVSTTPYALKAGFLKQLLVWEQWAEQTFQGQVQLEGQLLCRSMTFSNSYGVLWSVKFTKFFQHELSLTEYFEWESLFWSSCPCFTFVCWVCLFNSQASNQGRPHVAERRSQNHGLQSRWKEVLAGGKCILHVERT